MMLEIFFVELTLVNCRLKNLINAGISLVLESNCGSIVELLLLMVHILILVDFR